MKRTQPSQEALDALKEKADRYDRLNARRKAANARYIQNKGLTMIKLPIEARDALKRHCEQNSMTLLEGIGQAINAFIQVNPAPAATMPRQSPLFEEAQTLAPTTKAKGCYPSKDSSVRSKQRTREMTAMYKQGVPDEEMKQRLERMGFGTRQFESTLKKIKEEERAK